LESGGLEEWVKITFENSGLIESWNIQLLTGNLPLSISLMMATLLFVTAVLTHTCNLAQVSA
jgi:hypothetical protein